MDKTTSWLMRIASVFVIAAGATGIIFILDSKGVLKIDRDTLIWEAKFWNAKGKQNYMGN